MIEKITKLINDYKEAITEIEDSDLSDVGNAEKGIHLSRKYLNKLRKVVRAQSFNSNKQEIEFFKIQKPFVNGRLIYFLNLYQYLMERPVGTFKRRRKDIDERLERLHQKRNRYPDFERYYLQNDDRLDKYYFVRGKDRLQLVSDVSHYFQDPEFSTSHDILVAKIIANEMFINYLNNELDYIRKSELSYRDDGNHPVLNNDLSWTASKTDLVEMIYALQASGAIQEGKAEIKKMAVVCEKMFDIDLGNIYRTYLEIRERKMDRAKFLIRLKNALDKRMKDDDERY